MPRARTRREAHISSHRARGRRRQYLARFRCTEGGDRQPIFDTSTTNPTTALHIPTFRRKNPPSASSRLETETKRTASKGERAVLLSSTILSGVMGQTLPDLQRLEMVYGASHWSVEFRELFNYMAFHAAGLISLKLFRQRIPNETLYNILRNTPLLESLEVQWTAGDGRTVLAYLPRLRESEALPLVHLKSVSIGCPTISFYSLSAIWSLIRPHPDVRIRVLGAAFSRQEAIDFVSMLARHWQRANFDMLTVRWGDGRRSGFAISSSVSTPSNPQPCVEIEFAALEPQEFVPALIDQMFTLADRARIRVINFDVGFGSIIMVGETSALLIKFTAVEEFRVDLDVTGTLIELTYLGHFDRIPLPPFPALKTLVMKRINFSASTTLEAEGRGPACSFLEERKKHGVPVPKVVLRGMRLDSNLSFDGVSEELVLKELEAYVDVVVDQRRNQSEGIMKIIADEDFL